MDLSDLETSDIKEGEPDAWVLKSWENYDELITSSPKNPWDNPSLCDTSTPETSSPFLIVSGRNFCNDFGFFSTYKSFPRTNHITANNHLVHGHGSIRLKIPFPPDNRDGSGIYLTIENVLHIPSLYYSGFNPDTMSWLNPEIQSVVGGDRDHKFMQNLCLYAGNGKNCAVLKTKPWFHGELQRLVLLGEDEHGYQFRAAGKKITEQITEAKEFRERGMTARRGKRGRPQLAVIPTKEEERRLRRLTGFVDGSDGMRMVEGKRVDAMKVDIEVDEEQRWKKKLKSKKKVRWGENTEYEDLRERDEEEEGRCIGRSKGLGARRGCRLG